VLPTFTASPLAFELAANNINLVTAYLLLLFVDFLPMLSIIEHYYFLIFIYLVDDSVVADSK
jgi:hypothetical protein